MGGHIKVDAEKMETQALNMKINAEIFEAFQRRCKERNLPMYVVIETFCRQYANGRYYLNVNDIIKWKDNNAPTSTLNTSIDKEVYTEFKGVVKTRGFFVKNVLSAFIEDYANDDLIMEFADRDIYGIC